MKELLTNKIYFSLNLTKFDQVVNTTTSATAGNDLSPEMKTFYDKVLIKNATPNLVHDQFGQKKPIPKNGGKTVEFRRYSPLPKATTPLVEAVVPDGKPLNVTTVTATVSQYGDYITLSDMLLLTSIDNNIVESLTLLGDQSGRTLDTVTREVINAGTSVQYGDGTVSHRYDLDQTNDKMTVVGSNKAARYLKVQNAPKINGSYVAIIHPDVSYDIMQSDKWVDIQKYTTSDKIFRGEIGEIGGVRYVETTESKIFHAADLTAGARNLSVKTAITVAADTIAVKELITAADATALVGRKVLIGTSQYEIESASAAAAGSATITLTTSLTVAVDTVIYPGEAGAAGCDVYSTLVLGSNAYGVTMIEGGGLENIIKQLGSGGTSDPLNQKATCGWKSTKTAEILTQTFMIRVETASTFNSGAN
jgi:N4-gp56 family major capsid protein